MSNIDPEAVAWTARLDLVAEMLATAISRIDAKP